MSASILTNLNPRIRRPFAIVPTHRRVVTSRVSRTIIPVANKVVSGIFPVSSIVAAPSVPVHEVPSPVVDKTPPVAVTPTKTLTETKAIARLRKVSLVINNKSQVLDMRGVAPLEITLTGKGESELVVPNASETSSVKVIIINKCSKAVCVTDAQQRHTIIAVDKQLKIVKQGSASYIF